MAKIREIIGASAKPQVEMIEESVRHFDAYCRHVELLGEPGQYGPPTKKHKEKARSIADAFERLEKTLNAAWARNADAVLVQVLHHALSGDGEEFAAWKTQLTKWRECFEAFAGTLKVESPSFFPRERKGWSLGHQHKVKHKGENLVRARKAVAVAAQLCTAHDIKLRVTAISGTSSGSPFCRIAAVLHGGNKGISNQCRQFQLARRRGTK